MKLSARILSSLSVAAMAATTATPALAYIHNNNDVTVPVAVTTSENKRAVTSRQVVREFYGDLFQRDRVRTTAIADDTGRTLLPARDSWRQAGLRNANRHLLGNERGGEWRNSRHYTQGDMRRSSQEVTEGELLPPTIVQTGADASRPSRRAIRGNRNFNNYNRR